MKNLFKPKEIWTNYALKFLIQLHSGCISFLLLLTSRITAELDKDCVEWMG